MERPQQAGRGDPHQRPVHFYDTVFSSEHGPIPCTNEFTAFQPELINHALKWELHTPSNEFRTFIQLNKARSYADFREAIRHYSCPTQNFTFAGREDTIAVYHQGHMPVKWPARVSLFSMAPNLPIFTSTIYLKTVCRTK